jgi:hypothetical protein
VGPLEAVAVCDGVVVAAAAAVALGAASAPPFWGRLHANTARGAHAVAASAASRPSVRFVIVGASLSQSSSGEHIDVVPGHNVGMSPGAATRRPRRGPAPDTKRVVASFAAGMLAAVLGVACGLDKQGLDDAIDGSAVDDAGPDLDAPVFGPDAPAEGTDAVSSDVILADSGVAETGDGPPVDGTGPPPDAGCPGLWCNGQCTSAADCRGCSGAPILCRATGTCGADCVSCGDPVECFVCDINHQNPLGTCEPNDPGSYCLSDNYAGVYLDGGQGYHCGCGTTPDCPGGDQVCLYNVTAATNTCFTCGEAQVPTQGAMCKSGGHCNVPKAHCN